MKLVILEGLPLSRSLKVTDIEGRTFETLEWQEDTHIYYIPVCMKLGGKSKFFSYSNSVPITYDIVEDMTTRCDIHSNPLRYHCLPNETSPHYAPTDDPHELISYVLMHDESHWADNVVLTPEFNEFILQFQLEFMTAVKDCIEVFSEAIQDTSEEEEYTRFNPLVGPVEYNVDYYLEIKNEDLNQDKDLISHCIEFSIQKYEDKWLVMFEYGIPQNMTEVFLELLPYREGMALQKAEVQNAINEFSEVYKDNKQVQSYLKRLK
jgi:hypothetical protein